MSAALPVSFAARLGAYFGAVLQRLGATPLQVAIAEVIGGALAIDKGDGVYVSTKALRARCYDRGVRWALYDHAPSYGQVSAVLELLDSAGLLTWKRAHVRRWHGDAAWPIPRPIQTAPGTWRNPVRCIRVIGHAYAFLLALAVGATPIVTPGEKRAEKNQSTSRFESGYTGTTEVERENRNAPLSIEDALRADDAERAEWLRRMKLRL